MSADFDPLFYTVIGIYLLIIIGVVLFATSHIRHLSSIANEITGLRTAIADRFSPEGLAPAAAPKEGTVDLAALRLQACECFTLMLERISVPNLLLRQPPDPELTTREYTAQLLLSHIDPRMRSLPDLQYVLIKNGGGGLHLFYGMMNSVNKAIKVGR